MSSEMEKIGKVVQLAKYGVPGEKEAAINVLRRLCEKYNIDFDEVMSDDEKLEEYHIDHQVNERALILQVLSRYAKTSLDDDSICGTVGKKRTYFKTTKEKYIETLNAWEVLRSLYHKERKVMESAFFYGFLDKHWLYYIPTKKEAKKHSKNVEKSQKDASDEERKARRMGSQISQEMEDANIVKRLTTKE